MRRKVWGGMYKASSSFLNALGEMQRNEKIGALLLDAFFCAHPEKKLRPASNKNKGKKNTHKTIHISAEASENKGIFTAQNLVVEVKKSRRAAKQRKYPVGRA